MNIFLCGFMGSGKTTVGKALSTDLNMDFIDLDKLIEIENNESINEIFKNKGEGFFRNLETEALKNVCKNDNQVVSLGGGAVLKQENVDIIKANGTLIFLEVEAKTVLKRLKNDTSRPLLNVDNKEAVIEKMLQERTPIYKNNADFTVNANKNSKNTASFIKKIIKIWKNWFTL